MNINVAVQTENGLFVPVVRVSDWLGPVLLGILSYNGSLPDCTL